MPRLNRALLSALDSLINALSTERERNAKIFVDTPEEKLLFELQLARHIYVSACDHIDHEH